MKANNHSRRRKGAIFYVIDAFVASAIITLTITIILSSRLNVPPTNQVEEELNDYLRFLETRKINTLPSQTAASIISSEQAQPDDTILTAAIILLNDGNIIDAKALISEATALALEQQYGILVQNIWSNGTSVPLLALKTNLKERSNTLFTSRRFYYRQENAAEELFTVTIPGAGLTTGNSACAGAGGMCIYVYDPLVPDSYDAGVNGCSNDNPDWQARCQRYSPPQATTGIIEVTIWA